MGQTEYPEKATKENLERLIAKAEDIDKTRQKFKYILIFVLLYFLVAFFVLLVSLLLSVWLVVNGYLNFLVWFSPDIQGSSFVGFLFLFMGMFSMPILALWVLIVFRIMSKYSSYPTYEESIFSDSVLIANYLRNNERLLAKQQVSFLLSDLTGFCRNILFNPKRKIYSPEFDVLRSGKHQINRMLMFSKEDISQFFMDFGLAFVSGKDPEAFSKLKEIIERYKSIGSWNEISKCYEYSVDIIKARVRNYLGKEQYEELKKTSRGYQKSIIPTITKDLKSDIIEN